MEPAEATRKRARPGGGDQDRLSALPDCLLHVIMSRLKARQAVQTCVLSRRWRDLWLSVPCLDVDLDGFRTETAVPAFETTIAPVVAAADHNAGSGGEDGWPDSDDDISGSDAESSDSDSSDSSDGNSETDDDINPESSDSVDYSSSSSSSSSSDSDSSSSDSDDDSYYGGDKDKEWQDFEDFTVNLMHRCNIAQLDSFRLHIGRRNAPRFAHKQLAGWLRRAMKYCTPDPPSQHKGLSPNHWRLKMLYLCFVHLDNRFAKHVTSVCHTLEDLELHNCSCQIQSVTSDSLKTLVLKNCKWRNLSEITSPTLKTLVIDGGSNTHGCVLVILTPAVSYLHLAVSLYSFMGAISTNEMSSLVKASIHLQDHRNIGGNQFKLLSSVSNATNLELSAVGKKVLGKEPTFLEFMNLRNLLLGSCDLRDGFRTLGFFLQSSPNLEKVTLRHCKFPVYPEKKKGKTKLNNTSSSEFRGMDFMCKNLKVEIIYKHGDGHQHVKLLLLASRNLSKNNIKLTKR